MRAIRDPRPAPPNVGDPAPPLAGPTFAGSGFRLEDDRGRPLLLTFLRHAG